MIMKKASGTAINTAILTNADPLNGGHNIRTSLVQCHCQPWTHPLKKKKMGVW